MFPKSTGQSWSHRQSKSQSELANSLEEKELSAFAKEAIEVHVNHPSRSTIVQRSTQLNNAKLCS